MDNLTVLESSFCFFFVLLRYVFFEYAKKRYVFILKAYHIFNVVNLSFVFCRCPCGQLEVVSHVRG